MAAMALAPPVYAETVPLTIPAVPGWSGERFAANGWHPSFKGAAGELQASYRSETSEKVVDLYHVVYTGRPRQGHSLITYGNDLYDPAKSRLLSQSHLRVDLADGRRTTAGELRLTGSAGSRLIWYWYCVDRRCTRSAVWTKLLQAWDVLRGHVPRSSVWALSSAIINEDMAGTRIRMRAFAQSLSMSDDSDAHTQQLAGARKRP
jgi:EpsI family protein